MKLKAQVKKQKADPERRQEGVSEKRPLFSDPGAAEERERRSISERILREIKRAPRNLLGRGSIGAQVQIGTPELSESRPKTGKPADRYAAWIAEHEPDPATLEGKALNRNFGVRTENQFACPCPQHAG